MIEIENKFNNNVSTPSDINEHLPVLLNYSKECEHITEMGVRWVSSTWAFLLSNPKKLISYDIVKHPNIDEVIDLSKKNNIDYSFMESDVLKVEIEETDLLFIDTLHTYNQLFKELQKHSDKSKKYIILHDTNTFGFKDETLYEHASDIVKQETTTKTGLMNAVNDFLLTNNGKNWEIDKIYDNNNGLTILKRK